MLFFLSISSESPSNLTRESKTSNIGELLRLRDTSSLYRSSLKSWISGLFSEDFLLCKGASFGESSGNAKFFKFSSKRCDDDVFLINSICLLDMVLGVVVCLNFIFFSCLKCLLFNAIRLFAWLSYIYALICCVFSRRRSCLEKISSEYLIGSNFLQFIYLLVICW